MLENSNHTKYSKLGNPVLIKTWQHNGELKLLEATETHDIHVNCVHINNVQVKTHVWFRNLSSVSENITSELAETHTLTGKQRCCFNIQSTAAEKLAEQEE
jgi:hypothetical protein